MMIVSQLQMFHQNNFPRQYFAAALLLHPGPHPTAKDDLLWFKKYQQARVCFFFSSVEEW